VNDAFERARKAATHSSASVTRYSHSSVILDRNWKIIATGKNHFAGKVIETGDGHAIDKTIHSEVNALSKVNIRRLRGAILINYSRTNVASNLSRPCDNCWAILSKLGLAKVFYSVRSDLNKPIWVEERF
jgi:deoxycytidylate deaminase